MTKIKKDQVFEFDGHRCYKIGNKFYEILEPIEWEGDKKLYFGIDISKDNIGGFSLSMPKYRYDEGSMLVLCEIAPVLTENGLSVERASVAIMTETGMYVCGENEWVSDVCDKSFVIVHDRINESVLLKDMLYGDTLLKAKGIHDISYFDKENGREKVFVISKGYSSSNGFETEEVALEQVYEEFKKRHDLNHKLKDYGITFSQAKSIAWEYNEAKRCSERQGENFW